MGKDIRNAQRMERAYESRHERRQCPACGKWFVNSKARGWGPIQTFTKFDYRAQIRAYHRDAEAVSRLPISLRSRSPSQSTRGCRKATNLLFEEQP